MIKKEKKSFTAFGDINADRCKIPLHIASKTKINRSYRKFENHDETFIKHLANIQFTKEMMIDYLRWLYAIIANIVLCILVLDMHPFHQIDRIEQMVSDSDIELVFVLVEGIRHFRPPDRKIFVELKAALRQNSIDFTTSRVYSRSQFDFMLAL
jgi:hypothetical protein